MGDNFLGQTKSHPTTLLKLDLWRFEDKGELPRKWFYNTFFFSILFQALFHGRPEKISYCETAINNTLYLTFDTEADAQSAFEYLNNVVKVFKVRELAKKILTSLFHDKLRTFILSKLHTIC